MLGGIDYRTITAAVRRALRSAAGDAGSAVLVDPSMSSGFQAAPVAFNWKNRLINPDGAIYVRAAAATADDTYFANNWYALTQTGTVTPSKLTDPEDGYTFGVRITQSQAAAQRFGFAQIIEGKFCKDLRGKNGVLVPRIRCSSAQAIRYAILGWTSTEDAVTSDVVLDWTSANYAAGGFFLAANVQVLAVGAATPSGNAWTSLGALSAALGSTFNNIIIMVWTEGTAAQNVTLDFDYVQFERGAIATEFERRPYPIEDAMCRRYLPSWQCGTTTVDRITSGGCSAGNNGVAHFAFEVEARVVPTGVTTTTVGHFSFTDLASSNEVITLFAIANGGTKRGIDLNCSNAGGTLTAGRAGTLFGNTAGGYGTDYIIFTGAEL